ncbi:MAG: hypothetical protein ACE5E1_06240 [Phycisphaerae bacterium]
MSLEPLTFVLSATAPPELRQWLLVIGLILLIIILLNMSRRRRALDGSPKQYRREIDTANKRTAAIKRDMEQLLVELNEFARQTNAQIDTRFAKLEQSIADADRRIQFLRVLLDTAKRAGLAESPDLTEIERTASAAESNAAATGSGLDVLVGDVGVEQAAPERRPDDQPRPDSEKTVEGAASDAAGEDAGSIDRRIYAMADEGRTPVEIARALHQNVGEVELILNLRAQSIGDE